MRKRVSFLQLKMEHNYQHFPRLSSLFSHHLLRLSFSLPPQHKNNPLPQIRHIIPRTSPFLHSFSPHPHGHTPHSSISTLHSTASPSHPLLPSQASPSRTLSPAGAYVFLPRSPRQQRQGSHWWPSRTPTTSLHTPPPPSPEGIRTGYTVLDVL